MKSVPIVFTLNGHREATEVRANALMLDVIRDEFGLTGAKRSCDVQVCGACTIILDGRPVSSCTTLAAEMDGANVMTIEGLAGEGGELHPLQRSFVEVGALQCGFCTPGFILTAHVLLEEGVTDEEYVAGLEGNLCRCTGYRKIVEAVKGAAVEMALRHD